MFNLYVEKGSIFSTSLSALGIFCHFEFIHSNRYMCSSMPLALLSLITNYIEHIFMCLLDTCVFLWWNVYSNFLPTFKILSSYWFEGSLIYHAVSSLSDIWFAEIFSNLECLFIFFWSTSFKFFSFFSFFSFFPFCAFDVTSNTLPNPKSWFSSFFYILAFTFICLWFILS